MRCDNCGWMNPEGLDVCQKCNQKLRATNIEAKIVPQVVEREEATNVINCDKCGREYSSDLPSCPYCGFANHNIKASEKVNNVDLNKTVAFGMAKNDSSCDNSHDEVESAPESPIGKPFNIGDSSDLKKTIIAGRNGFGDLSTENESQSQQSQPKISPKVSKSLDLKATIVDASAVTLMQTISDSIEEVPVVEKEVETNTYTLHSMDHEGDTPIVLTITATKNIGLKSNDIILINGIRYYTK